MKLTNEQQIAIDSVINGKNSYLNAGPGSGKSSTLAELCKQLIKNSNNYVMLVTFTNKAAKEILHKAEGEHHSNISGGTFHKISYRLMKSYGANLQICDEGKKRLIIKKVFNCKRDKDKYERVYKSISKSKSVYPVKVTPMVEQYQAELAKYSMIDFDDIINYGVDFIKDRKPQFKLTHILVDELQDTSQNQLQMLVELQKLTGCMMVGVGDGDQVLYEWRNAKPKNVQDFIEIFDCNVLNLGINFRSDISIVRASARLISNNKDRLDKDLRAYSTQQGKVTIIPAWNPFDEIDKVIGVYKKTTSPITILYRDRLNKMKLEYGLRKAGIDYIVSDSNDIVDRLSFRVLLSILKISANAYDIYDLEEASKGLKKIGNTTIAKVRSYMDTKEVDDIVFDLMSKAGTRNLTIINSIRAKFKVHEKEHHTLDKLIEELPNYIIPSFEIPSDILEFLKDICSDYHTTISDIRDICNDFGLDNTKKDIENKDSRVTLSTIHGFKGLESDIIIIPFCDWTMRPDDSTKNIVEAERRVFYVGITRAKHELYLTYSGTMLPRFIKEMKL